MINDRIRDIRTLLEGLDLSIAGMTGGRGSATDFRKQARAMASGKGAAALASGTSRSAVRKSGLQFAGGRRKLQGANPFQLMMNKAAKEKGRKLRPGEAKQLLRGASKTGAGAFAKQRRMGRQSSSIRGEARAFRMRQQVAKKQARMGRR